MASASTAGAFRRKRCCTREAPDRSEARRRRGACISASRGSSIDKLRGWKDQVVSKLTGGTGQLAKLRKVQYIQGTRVDQRRHVVRGRDGARREHVDIQARHPRHRIASGDRAVARDRQPARDGLDRRARARRRAGPLLVVGGGYIGLELGTVYAALGIEGDRRRDDCRGCCPAPTAISSTCWPSASRRCASTCYLSTKVVALREEADGLHVTLESEDLERREELFDKRARVGRPQAEFRHPRAGEDEGRSGRARLHQGRCAAADRRAAIYAIGDVVGEPMLAHKASHEGARRRRSHSRRGRRLRAAGDSGRRLHRSGTRLVRSDRGAGEEGRPSRSRSPSSRGAHRDAR